MSALDLERQIITSAEAKAFLQMVTEGFYSQSRTGLWIFEVIGREWDELRAWADGMKEEIFPQTCTWSVGIWEWVYGIETDETLDLDYRRQRILARVRLMRPINPETIRRGVASLIGTGTEAVEVRDFVGPYRFEVVVHPQETPIPYERIKTYVREIKPSHLAFELAAETLEECSNIKAAAAFQTVASTTLPEIIVEITETDLIGSVQTIAAHETITKTTLAEMEALNNELLRIHSNG